MILFKHTFEQYKEGQIIFASNEFAKSLRADGVAYTIEETKLAAAAAARAGIAPDNGRWMHQWLLESTKKPIPDDRIASVEQIESIPNPPSGKTQRGQNK